ncbi:MAG: hypothetical protein U0694_01820 [Anaerolineae bacterium]
MTPDEQAVFMKMAVFRGGFTREAAQAVAGASLKTLMTLVNKSLLRRDASSGRYAVHELLRQYAAEQLQQLPDEQRATCDRHCRLCYGIHGAAPANAAARGQAARSYAGYGARACQRTRGGVGLLNMSVTLTLSVGEGLGLHVLRG